MECKPWRTRSHGFDTLYPQFQPPFYQFKGTFYNNGAGLVFNWIFATKIILSIPFQSTPLLLNISFVNHIVNLVQMQLFFFVCISVKYVNLRINFIICMINILYLFTYYLIFSLNSVDAAVHIAHWVFTPLLGYTPTCIFCFRLAVCCRCLRRMLWPWKSTQQDYTTVVRESWKHRYVYIIIIHSD